MTTSLSKSTIPEYDPNNNYQSPRQVPRVKFEAQEIYQKNRGSLNIGDWSIQAQDWNSPRPQPKVKYEEAQQTYNKHKGFFNIKNHHYRKYSLITPGVMTNLCIFLLKTSLSS